MALVLFLQEVKEDVVADIEVEDIKGLINQELDVIVKL